jgi:aryl-alcohol dehydrogenase-like predicted oxidoreductase
MKTVKVPTAPLGSTGMRVSKLGFGTYDFGIPELKISPEQGGRILSESFKLGVNFWDTSEDYGSHPHVASALKFVPRKDVVISTKTNAKNGEEATKGLKTSLKELDTDYIDVFLLHYVKSDWIDGCQQALKQLSDFKTTGAAKAIGLSTHSVTVARKAREFKELDVILAICCKADQAIIGRFHEHIPLEDGSIEEMLQTLKSTHDRGKGVIAMKVLGGICTSCGLKHPAPPLLKNYQSSIKSIAQLDFVDSMVIGMKKIDEVKKNMNAILSETTI